MNHFIHVASLPVGPLWLLHSLYLVATALMLVWYLRFTRPAQADSVVRELGVRALTITRITDSEQEAAA